MNRVLALLLFVPIMAGCGSTSSAVSGTLERYQSLGRGLESVTARTATAARDATALSARMASADRFGTRMYAGRLRWDAARLASISGHEAASISVISHGERDGVRRHYFTAVLAALSSEWLEAGDLSRLATLVWWDPNVSIPGHAGRLRQLVAAARWHALQSVRFTRQAQGWRDSHGRSFRYVVVKPADSVAAGSGSK